MNQRQSQAEQDQGGAGSESTVGLSRRRMLRRGLGVAAPVVATLASGPVSAGACLNPSGFASLATFNSRHPTGMNNCSGKSPSDWHALPAGSWPVPKFDVGGTTPVASTKFNDTIGAGGFGLTLGTNLNPSLDEILAQPFGTGGPLKVAPGIVALWLDTKANLVGSPPIFTVSQIATIWQSISTNFGAYKPPTGTIWTQQQTVDWITRSWT